MQLRALLILYRQLYPYTIATTLCMWLLAGYPTFSSPDFLSFSTYFFWLRSFAQLLIWLVFRLSNRQGFAFYHHFGLSEIELAIGSYVIDLILFTTWLCLVSLLPL